MMHSYQDRMADADIELTLCSKTYPQHSSSAQHYRNFSRNISLTLVRLFVVYATFFKPLTMPVLQVSARDKLAFSVP
jgi:hypothetical protein